MHHCVIGSIVGGCDIVFVVVPKLIINSMSLLLLGSDCELWIESKLSIIVIGLLMVDDLSWYSSCCCVVFSHRFDAFACLWSLFHRLYFVDQG